jgi:hypothetical protein
MATRSLWRSISALFRKTAGSKSAQSDVASGSVSELQPSRLDDSPVAFGYKMDWIAVRHQNARDVAETLGLESIEASGWLYGCRRAYEARGVFVTPPVLGWTMALGALPQAGYPDFLPFMESVSKTFHQAFYFGNLRIVDYYAWAVAEDGTTKRAYAWFEDHVSLNIGERTAEEVVLGTGLQGFEHAPYEVTVLDLASRWVLDPRELDTHPEARGPGLFGMNQKGLFMEQFFRQLRH